MSAFAHGPVDEVTWRLRRLVDATTPGGLLPAERRLATELGVGRAIVRLALRRLDAEGLVRTLPQVGTVVQRPNHEDDRRTA